jgi:enamine deaminase RidA (YjgF/YER057c/UK114 family)
MSKRETVNPGWPIFDHLTFAPAVRKGNMLFISGTDATTIDAETGKLVVKGDFAEQYRTIFEKMKMILEAAGATFDDVVWTCDYIRTREGYKATADVRREFLELPGIHRHRGQGTAQQGRPHRDGCHSHSG